jgi:hypothetical protein
VLTTRLGGWQGGLDNYLVNTKPDKMDSELGLWLKELVCLSLALARCCSIYGFSCALSSPVGHPPQRFRFVRSLLDEREERRVSSR